MGPSLFPPSKSSFKICYSSLNLIEIQQEVEGSHHWRPLLIYRGHASEISDPIHRTRIKCHRCCSEKAWKHLNSVNLTFSNSLHRSNSHFACKDKQVLIILSNKLPNDWVVKHVKMWLYSIHSYHLGNNRLIRRGKVTLKLAHKRFGHAFTFVNQWLFAGEKGLKLHVGTNIAHF